MVGEGSHQASGGCNNAFAHARDNAPGHENVLHLGEERTVVFFFYF